MRYSFCLSWAVVQAKNCGRGEAAASFALPSRVSQIGVTTRSFFISHCSPWRFTIRSTRSSFKCNMATPRLKNVLFNRRLTAFSIKSSLPLYTLRTCPAAQTRWSSATTEPRQTDADGGTKGGPSTQSYIKYTSESYASSTTLLSLALT